MKILSAKQIKAADAYTIANEPIASVDLMERAARACYGWFLKNISREKCMAIVCGKGNNGGDGLALARMLKAAGYRVLVFVAEHSPKEAPDFTINYQRLKAWNIAPRHIQAENDIGNEAADVWVDALLGSGLNAVLSGIIKDLVAALNQKTGQRIAIDIPTGLFADDNRENNLQCIFKADVTLTFHTPKFSFLFPEFGPMAGNIEVLDIGLSRHFVENAISPNFYLTDDFVRGLLPHRSKFDHKGTFGHAYILAGSKGKIGAAVLASRAAMCSGAGLVTASVPQCGVDILQISVPEVMVLPDAGEDFLVEFPKLGNASSIGIGPGIGRAPEVKVALQKFLLHNKAPMVLDADALNILAESEIWDFVPAKSILTPHVGELKRMLRSDVIGEEMYSAARQFATDKKVILIVKGAHTAIYLPNGQVFFNSTGNSGMATAGSGDVLTGIITGLLAQGMPPEHAAMAGVYHHGKAGDAAFKRFGSRAINATDIIHELRIE